MTEVYNANLDPVDWNALGYDDSAWASVKVVAYEYPAERRGLFDCSDATLTALWEKSVRSAYLQLEDTYIMDFARERMTYPLVGEMEQSHLALYAGYGDVAATDLHFRQTTRMQTADGQFRIMLGCCGNPGFPPSGMPQACTNPHTLLNYMPFYGQAVRNRFLYFAKAGFLEEQYPVLLRLARLVFTHISRRGAIRDRAHATGPSIRKEHHAYASTLV